MNIRAEAFEVIKNNPGLRISGVVRLLGLPLRLVEDVVYDLYAAGEIQINPDSTLRVTRDGEKVFRYDV